MDKVFVYVDGRARSGAGEAGIGIAITDKDGNVLEEVSHLIGRTTSEVAEYRALIEGAERAQAYSPGLEIFFVDNQNLVNGINGLFVSRQPHLRHLTEAAKVLLDGFPQWRVNLIDDDTNRLAQRLVEQAFHNRIAAQATRERLELRLLARASRLADEEMEELIRYAERLAEKD